MAGTGRRPLRHDAAAVSPVIATLLMVAVTVVLGAALYVSVSDFAGKSASDTPPNLQFTTYAAGTAQEWRVVVAGATPDSPGLDGYRLLVGLPNGTKVVATTGSNADFAAGEDSFYANLDATAAGALLTATDTAPGPATPHLRIRVRDVSGDDLLNALDEIVVGYDSSDANGAYDNTLARGFWSVQVIHLRTEGTAGSAEHQLV